MSVDNKKLCMDLLQVEDNKGVERILKDHGLLDDTDKTKTENLWHPLGNMPNNFAIVRNLMRSATGGLVEKVINSIDAMLTKECLLRKIPPKSTNAPQSMSEASEAFFGVQGGNLANITDKEQRDLAENVQLVATGSKDSPSYLIIDKGEGQTPARLKDTFLELIKSNKGGISFVQGTFNCGGTGVLPFLGRNGSEGYQLIISRRCPGIPSDPSDLESRDDTHDMWGFTLVREIPVSAGIWNTDVYVYLAPDGEILSFQADTLNALPAIPSGAIGEETDLEEEEDTGVEESKSASRRPQAYQEGLEYGSVVKLYEFDWTQSSIATIDVRFALEKYLFQLPIPFRVVETRGYDPHYFATTVSGVLNTVEKDRKKGFIDGIWPGVINPLEVGGLKISTILYREHEKRAKGEKRTSKDPRRLPIGVHLMINGQSHEHFDKRFFTSRGLAYDFIKDNLIVLVDCTNLTNRIYKRLVMPSRDRFRDIPELGDILKVLAGHLKDMDVLRDANDKRKLRRAEKTTTPKNTNEIFQRLVNKDRYFAAELKGQGLRNPFIKDEETSDPPVVFSGTRPPTFFEFENKANSIEKSFAIDRTCRVVLKTDAENGYFDLPNPNDRGRLEIDPNCFVSNNLNDGHLNIVFRAPNDARVGGKVDVVITVTDPVLEARGDEPFINRVTLTLTEGGKETKSVTKEKRKTKPKGKGKTKPLDIGLPRIEEVYKNSWDDPQFNFDEYSGFLVTAGKNEDEHIFWVNMDNLYLKNYLISAKDHEKVTYKHIYQLGLVIQGLGLLNHLKTRKSNDNGEYQDSHNEPRNPRDLVSDLSSGLARTIIPTVKFLEKVTEEAT